MQRAPVVLVLLVLALLFGLGTWKRSGSGCGAWAGLRLLWGLLARLRVRMHRPTDRPIDPADVIGSNDWENSHTLSTYTHPTAEAIRRVPPAEETQRRLAEEGEGGNKVNREWCLAAGFNPALLKVRTSKRTSAILVVRVELLPLPPVPICRPS